MHCPLCACERASGLLRKPAAEVFLGGYPPGQTPIKLPCAMDQCQDCGHVYQPADQELLDALRDIYQGAQAQASTSTGVGQWGVARAERAYALARLDEPPRRVLEIGSPNGYVLGLYRRDGAQLAVGVDPSLPGDLESDGVRLIKGFFPDALKGLDRFDCVTAFNVVEHIPDVMPFLAACREALVDGGALCFSTPNCQIQLEQGDPAVFMHEHAHYFTAGPLRRMLAAAGFADPVIRMEPDNIHVRAFKRDVPPGHGERPVSWLDYGAKLETALDRFAGLFAPDRTVLAHGANNSLNNILHWSRRGPGRLLVTDNDPNKHGKLIAGVAVQPREEIDLRGVDAVAIIPFAFAAPIREGYLQAGYGGEFVLLTVPPAIGDP